MKTLIKTSSLSRVLLALFAALALFTASCASTSSDTASTEDEKTEETAASTNDTAEEEAADEEADEETEEADSSSDDGIDRSDWPEKLMYGAVPAENAQSLGDYVAPKILAEGLGVEIDFIQAADYAGVIEGMVAEKVDIGAFGGFSYVIATGAGANIDVAGIWAGDTPDTIGDYRSYLLTQPDSDINSIEDLKGKKVCFVDPGSTSGFLFPSEGLLSAGMDPSETSTDIEATFAGGHDASAIAVANGDCDAGFAYDSMVTEQLIESGDLTGVIDDVEDENINPDEANVRIIWKSLPIAAPPLAYGKWLPESMQAEIKRITAENINVDYAVENGFCDSKDDCPLADGPFWGYLANDDSYFDGIRKLCEVTGSAKCEG